MYKRVPTQIVVAVFHGEDRADAILEEFAKLSVESGTAICTNIVIATKDANSKVVVKELGKPGPLKGMAVGGVAGGSVGAVVGGLSLAILGPIGVAAGAAAGALVGAPLGAARGAAIGNIGKIAVDGMDKDKLEGLGEALEPETSALVLVFDEVRVKKKKFEDELKAYKEGTDILVKEVNTSIKKNLKQGNDLIYLFAIAEDGFVGMKMVNGAEVDMIQTLILTDDGMAAGGAVATKDAVIAGGVVVMDGMMMYEVDAA
jgi:uncharacterized membrane protein